MKSIVVLSLGAGVQSSVLYLRAARGDFGERPDFSVFADTMDEPPHVYRQLDWLDTQAGKTIPIVRATAGRLSDEVIRSIRETPSQFVPIPTYIPGEDGREKQGRRQCTRTHKTAVVAREIRKRLGKGQTAELWLGISTDEAHRAKDSRYPRITHRFPLLFEILMRRSDCLEWMKQQGYPISKKSSCVYCPFHGDRDWARMKAEDPESFEKAVLFERRMRELKPNNYLHDSCKPLDEVEFWQNRDQPSLFGSDCEGMCGT